jgi:LruC domain-containing protein
VVVTKTRLTFAGALAGAALSIVPLAARAQSASYYPSETGSSLLAFEDQWPSVTDYDYNDVVVQVNWAFDRDTTMTPTANGHPVLRAVLTVDPVAIGGLLDNGFGVRLPTGVSKTGLVVRRRIGTGGSSLAAPTYGAAQTLTLAADAAPTVVVSSNLRELFASEAGRLNVGVTGLDGRIAQRLEVTFDWPVGVDLPVSQAPFDLYIFRTATPSHEIHFPAFNGTSAMNVALFPAGNGTGKWYVNNRGIPAALNLMTAAAFPTEATPIDTVFPGIVDFAQLANFDTWSGTGEDPRLYYQRQGGAGGRRTRPTAPLMPARGAIVREDCTDGLGSYRVGKRITPTSACVDAGPVPRTQIPPVVTSGLRLLIDANNPTSVNAGSSVAVDLSGNGFNGTFRNAAGAATALGSMDTNLRYDTTDTPAACLDFVGFGSATQGYLQFSSHPLGGFGTYTVEAWFKAPSLAPVAEYNVIFYSSAPDGGIQQLGLMAQNSIADPDLALEVGNAYTAGGSNERVDLLWNHLVMVYDGSQAYLYRNGSLIWTVDQPDNNVLPTSGWNWIGVGQWAQAGYDGSMGYTQGKLGWLSLYGRALSAAEVTQNWNAVRGRFGR